MFFTRGLPEDNGKETVERDDEETVEREDAATNGSGVAKKPFREDDSTEDSDEEFYDCLSSKTGRKSDQSSSLDDDSAESLGISIMVKGGGKTDPNGSSEDDDDDSENILDINLMAAKAGMTVKQFIADLEEMSIETYIKTYALGTRKLALPQGQDFESYYGLMEEQFYNAALDASIRGEKKLVFPNRQITYMSITRYENRTKRDGVEALVKIAKVKKIERAKLILCLSFPLRLIFDLFRQHRGNKLYTVSLCGRHGISFITTFNHHIFCPHSEQFLKGSGLFAILKQIPVDQDPPPLASSDDSECQHVYDFFGVWGPDVDVGNPVPTNSIVPVTVQDPYPQRQDTLARPRHLDLSGCGNLNQALQAIAEITSARGGGTTINLPGSVTHNISGGENNLFSGGTEDSSHLATSSQVEKISKQIDEHGQQIQRAMKKHPDQISAVVGDRLQQQIGDTVSRTIQKAARENGQQNVATEVRVALDGAFAMAKNAVVESPLRTGRATIGVSSPNHFKEALAEIDASTLDAEDRQNFDSFKDALESDPNFRLPQAVKVGLHDLGKVLLNYFGEGNKQDARIERPVFVTPDGGVFVYYSYNEFDPTCFEPADWDIDDFQSCCLRGLGYNYSLTIPFFVRVDATSEVLQVDVVIAAKHTSDLAPVGNEVAASVLPNISGLSCCEFASWHNETKMDMYVKPEALEILLAIPGLKKISFASIVFKKDDQRKLSRAGCLLSFAKCEFVSNAMTFYSNPKSSLNLRFYEQLPPLSTLARGVENGRVKSLQFEHSNQKFELDHFDQLNSMADIYFAARKGGHAVGWGLAGKESNAPFKLESLNWPKTNMGSADVRDLLETAYENAIDGKMTDDEFLDFFRFYRDKRAGIDPASEKVSASDPETVQRTAEEEPFSLATAGMEGVSSTGADSAPLPTATATNLAYPCSSASASESPAGSIMNGAKSPIYKSAVPVARKSENYELKADVESQDAAAMVPLAAEVDPPLSSSSLIGEDPFDPPEYYYLETTDKGTMIYVSSDKTTVRYENGPTFFTAKMPTNSKKGYCGNCARRSKACSSHVLGPAPER